MILVLTVLSYIDPMIGPHLYSLGLPETYGGYCLGLEGGMHLLGSFTVGFLTSFKNQNIILFAYITSTLSIFASGPS